MPFFRLAFQELFDPEFDLFWDVEDLGLIKQLQYYLEGLESSLSDAFELFHRRQFCISLLIAILGMEK